jgi:hypothetical protein
LNFLFVFNFLCEKKFYFNLVPKIGFKIKVAVKPFAHTPLLAERGAEVSPSAI